MKFIHYTILKGAIYKMFCEKCGSKLPENSNTCVQCGFVNSQIPTPTQAPAAYVPAAYPKLSFKKNSFKGAVAWLFCAGASFLTAIFFIFKGFNKIVSYYLSDFGYEMSKNAYVDDDAFNYIINSNYATAFFVLAATFVLLGACFIVIYYLSVILRSQKNDLPKL